MDIAYLFKSKTRKALFKLYFSNPDAEYYLRELERVLDIPVSMIRKELMRLEKEDVFALHKKGNLSYYCVNKSYLLFEELKSIVFKTIGIQRILKEALKKIKDINAAFIYGSFAKGSEKATSDVDILIVGNPDENKLAQEINGAERTIKREINYTVYAMSEFGKKKRKKDPFILDLLENPKIFLIGDGNVL
ncbi:MAG: nucleotidyltransferase domain-containing protein [Candidatus Omnitrophota bacterium]